MMKYHKKILHIFGEIAGIFLAVLLLNVAYTYKDVMTPFHKYALVIYAIGLLVVEPILLSSW